MIDRSRPYCESLSISTARFARLRGNGYHFQMGSECEARAAETGETETDEIGSPSVAVLMLPNVNIGFDNTRDWVYN